MGRRVTAEMMINRDIGPQRVGGRYRAGYDRTEYAVIAITRMPENWRWTITVATDAEMAQGTWRTHRTAWDPRRDRVIHQPETEIESLERCPAGCRFAQPPGQPVAILHSRLYACPHAL